MARVNLNILASCVLRKRAPNYASAAEAATSFRIAHVIIAMFPLSLIGFPFTGTVPMKKYPLARDRACEAVRYDASECTLRIMSEA